MTTELDFCLLGPLKVRRRGLVITVPPGNQRVLLAALHQQAHAHDGLGHAHQATGNHGEARSHWKEALELYTELGAPEAGQIRAQLSQYP